MLKRFKQALVESFVGAIALGWLLAESVIHFVGIFAAPLAVWASRKEYLALTDKIPQGIPFYAAGPELVRCVFLLLIWFLLLRWLYLQPVEQNKPESGM